MATSQAAPATTAAAAVAGGTASTTSETFVGWHVFRIDGFSSTKDLGVGKSIKSSTFRVGGLHWYIECYPCGDVQGSAGWVTLFPCIQAENDSTAYRVSADWEFTLMESLKDGCFEELDGHPSRWVTIGDDDDDMHSPPGTDFISREKLESLLKDDCFQVRCLVLMNKQFPDVDTETISWSHSHVMTVEGYASSTGALPVGVPIDSTSSYVGGNGWFIRFYPFGEDKNDADGVTTYLCLEDPDDENVQVKVRFEMALLTLAGQKISSIQDFYTFSESNWKCLCKFLSRMEHASSSLLQDGIQIRCDMAVVKGIREVQPPPNLGPTDVTFEVGGDLFSAHKCVLAIRSTAFMAEFFGPASEKESNAAGVVTDQVLRIDDMEPRVFKALLHFIYTDTVPEVREDDKVGMAQGLLVAADRYGMERLKLICGDMLCSCIDATTAVATMELAAKHGCLKLKEACIKVIRDLVAPQGYSLIPTTE